MNLRLVPVIRFDEYDEWVEWLLYDETKLLGIMTHIDLQEWIRQAAEGVKIIDKARQKTVKGKK